LDGELHHDRDGKEIPMTGKLSVEDVLATLEARAVFHREQEAHYRAQCALHATELEKVEKSLEAFRAAAPLALELARQVDGAAGPLAAAARPPVEIPVTGRVSESKVIRAVVAYKETPEPFGASIITREVNRHFHDWLKSPTHVRRVANVLRRMEKNGTIRVIRHGKAFHESLYVRESKANEPS
jgi:hypothetical protein